MLGYRNHNRTMDKQIGGIKMKIDLLDIRLQVKRCLCTHDYYTIAIHKTYRANLWKCKKCGDLLYQNYNNNLTVSHYNKMVNEDDWTPWPSSRNLKEELRC